MPDKSVIMPNDYKDVIWRMTYFFLGKIAHWVPRAVTPNQLTLSAFASAILACLLLYFVQSPIAYLYWALFNFIWYTLDALDGIHARLTQQTSGFGAFLDHFLDNIFFIIMFITFVVKFDLSYPFYIFILLLRFTAATTVFLVEYHTKRLYVSRFSGGLEFLLMTIVMIFSYFFPTLDLSQHITNPALLYCVNLLHLQQGIFMKLILLVYLVGVPATFIVQFNFVRRELIHDKSRCNS